MDHLVLYAPRISPYLHHPFPDGTTALDHLIRRVEALQDALDSLRSVHVLCGESARDLPVPQTWNVIEVDGKLGDELASAAAFRALDAKLDGEDGAVILTAADGPFFDIALARYLHSLHRQAWCDYTFGDGFPTGYAVEILRRGVLSSLAQLAEGGNQTWTRSFVFDALSSDINAFDVETEAAVEDLALLRLSLTVDTRANFALCRRLVERKLTDPTDPRAVPDPARERYDHRHLPLLAALRDDAALRRTLPYYYQIQITDEMAQRPAYLPWDDPQLEVHHPGEGTFLSPERWDQLIAQIAEVTPEAVISVGYRGDPALHPELPRLIDTLQSYSGLQLYVETSGLAWSDTHISALQSPSVAAVIVELDTIDAERYRELRGEGFAEAMKCMDRLLQVIPGRVYAQATRMKDTEWELQAFFRHWDAVDGVTPLIQKYNSWAGRLADRRVMDLAPLHRIPCWHLQRDMVIRMNGDVPRCFQDLQGEEHRGNVFAEGVVPVWERGEAEFVDHSRGTIASMCERCDEYYTFNA
ncbi:MAG: spiro-SPASM protein [Alkalispirochaeta sp.]